MKKIVLFVFMFFVQVFLFAQEQTIENVIKNFDTVEDTNKCNRVLSFLSGLIYAVSGKSYQIGAESYLIAIPEAFEDGSLEKWVKEFGHPFDD